MIPASIAFHHFGCKVNFAEASSISRQFKEGGFLLKNYHEVADIYVISSCVVTSVAEKKCRAAIHQAHKLNPNAKIAVIGCFPELKPGELSKIEGVDLVLGNSSKYRLLEEIIELTSDYHGSPLNGELKTGMRAEPVNFLSHEANAENAGRSIASLEFIPSFSYGDRTRSFLKIQDGCDYYCSYCTIPLARGRSRSDTIEHVLDSAREIAANGAREIVLTGVNIGDFGRQHAESLIQLLRALDKLDEPVRIRISSLEPDLLSDEIIDVVSGSGKFMPHFHIPLQSGSDKILKAMKRKYNRDVYTGRVEKIKQLMPFACIAADIITGFPGESDSDFDDTCNYLSKLPVSYLHVFTYSKRANTLAAGINITVPETVKKARSRTLHHLSDEKKSTFYLQNKGREVNVLFESDNTGGWMHGFSENYIKIKTRFNPLLSNRIMKVMLSETDRDGVYIHE
jgi:threonylcarbamoyladenosine tRNA methylthiotransferase MtaB